MIGHIFKKDCRLLWPFALAVATIQFVYAAGQYLAWRTGAGRGLGTLLNLLMVVSFLGVAFLIAADVHLDAIPGVRQDWLVRPVRRVDLLLSKLLFVVVMVQGPIFVTDLLQGLANGFPFKQSLAAAFSRSVFLLVGLCLPAMAFTALASNTTEAVITGSAIFAIGAVLVTLAASTLGDTHRTVQFNPTEDTGLAWIGDFARLLVGLLAAAIVLCLQYFRRKTIPARSIFAGAFVVYLLTLLIPWHPAFALEERLSPQPGAGSAVQLAFDPRQGAFKPPLGSVSSNLVLSDRPGVEPGNIQIHLPLNISGLANDVVLKADKSEVRLTGLDGRNVFMGTGGELEVFREGHSDVDTHVQDSFLIPAITYNSIKDQRLRVEIRYSLTLLRLDASYAIPALRGNERLPGVGWCTTKVDNEGDDVSLHCMQAGKRMDCASVFLEHAPSGRRNPEAFACGASYAPYSGKSNPDAMSRFSGSLPFLDLSGLARYPVDGGQLADSHLVLRVYTVEDHFTRVLVIPAITLKDWAAQTE
jgi:hypothetical protein